MSQGPVKAQDVKINQIIVNKFIGSYKTKDKDGKVKEEKTKQLLSYIGYISNANKLVIPTGMIKLDVHGIPSEKYCSAYLNNVAKYLEIPLDTETTNGKNLYDFLNKLTKFAKSKETIDKLFNDSGVSNDEIKDIIFNDIIHKKDVDEIRDKLIKDKKEVPEDLELKRYITVPFLRANFAYDGKIKTIFAIKDPKYKKGHPDHIREFEVSELNSNGKLQEMITFGSQIQALLMIQNFWSPTSINKKKGEKRSYGISIKIIKIEITPAEKSQNNSDWKEYMFEDDEQENEQDQENDQETEQVNDQDEDQENDQDEDQDQNDSGEEEIVEEDEDQDQDQDQEEEVEEEIEEPTPPPKVTKNVKPQPAKTPVKKTTKKQ